MARTCVLIPGDGIGPEVSDAVVKVLDAAGADLVWERHLAGQSALEAGEHDVLPDATTDAGDDAGLGDGAIALMASSLHRCCPMLRSLNIRGVSARTQGALSWARAPG